MKTIAVVNRKGGVGKSTTAHYIAAYFARKGAKVLMVDLDAQCTLTFLCGGKATAHNSFTTITGNGTAAEAIQVIKDNLYLIPGSPQLITCDKLIDSIGKEHRLREALAPIQGYDYCIVDTPPTLGILTTNALTAADYVIIPAQADETSLQGMAQVAEDIQLIQKYANARLKIAGVAITRFNSRSAICKATAEEIARRAAAIGSQAYSTRVRECNAIREAQHMREDIFTYAPKSNASKDYLSLGAEIERSLDHA